MTDVQNPPPSRPLRVYVAGSAENDQTVALAKDVADALEARGLIVPFRWTDESVREAYFRGDLAGVGRAEMDAVLSADLLVVLPGRLGTAMEMGMAIARQIPIYLFVMDDLTPTSCSWRAVPFVHLPIVQRHTIAEGRFDDDGERFWSTRCPKLVFEQGSVPLARQIADCVAREAGR